MVLVECDKVLVELMSKGYSRGFDFVAVISDLISESMLVTSVV